jgi:hypothetical protein
MKILKILAILAILSVVLASGCTQIPSGGTGGIVSKEAEDKAAAALDSELEQAVANMTEADLEQALLDQ